MVGRCGSGPVSGEWSVSDPTPPGLNRIPLPRVGLRPPRSPWHLRKPISSKGIGTASRGPLLCRGPKIARQVVSTRAQCPGSCSPQERRVWLTGKGACLCRTKVLKLVTRPEDCSTQTANIYQPSRKCVYTVSTPLVNG